MHSTNGANMPCYDTMNSQTTTISLSQLQISSILNPAGRSSIPTRRQIDAFRVYQTTLAIVDGKTKGSHIEIRISCSSLPNASVLLSWYSSEASCSALSNAQAIGGGRAANSGYGQVPNSNALPPAMCCLVSTETCGGGRKRLFGGKRD